MTSKLQEQYDAILTARLIVNKEMVRLDNKSFDIGLGEFLLDAAETIKNLMKLVELTKSQ